MTKEKVYDLPDAEITFFPEFLDPNSNSRIFKELLHKTPWRQDNITVFGKTYKQPRLTCFYASNAKPYSYSGITMKPYEFTSQILEIKKKIDRVLKTEFTSCLINLYRDGKDSNGWHADNEKELGANPLIASVSFGAERLFKMKHKTKNMLKQDILLTPGSLLIMSGPTQNHWLHQIPKTRKKVGERINLTFRIIK